MSETKSREKITVIDLPIAALRSFEEHPYKVVDNEEMASLVDSIYNQGILTPITVRPLANGEYEIVSGHRRVFACKKLGIEKIPSFVKELTREEAIVIMTDSNLHRDGLLPSEKAFAYKMKRDALSHQGKTSPQVGEKLLTVEKVGLDAGDSKNQVLRYIRLTELITEILLMVDNGKIALTPAVELSYLTKQEQRDLLETMESEDCTPSLSQAIQMKRLSQSGELDMDRIFDILREPKGNQIDKISFRTEDLRKFFPKSYSAARIQETILKLLSDYQKKRQRSREER